MLNELITALKYFIANTQSDHSERFFLAKLKLLIEKQTHLQSTKRRLRSHNKRKQSVVLFYIGIIYAHSVFELSAFQQVCQNVPNFAKLQNWDQKSGDG